MNLYILSIIAFVTFLILFLLLLLAFTKSNEKISSWSLLTVFLFIASILSWWSDDMTLRWVFLEATSLVSALLISLSRTEKSIEVAWQFLLLNSFGLGLAFMGLIILSYGIHSSVTMNTFEIMKLIPSHQNLLVEAGLWLTVFGYSSKLGLFPNHFWVTNTYSESPSQISAMLSSLVSTSVCIALRPILQMDALYTDKHFSSSFGLLILGLMTIVYSLWVAYESLDIRKVFSQIALMHSGMLAVVLYLNLPDNVFYYILGGNILTKALLFTSLGIFRIDSGTRNIQDIKNSNSISKIASYLLFITFGVSFIVPFSPIFVTDLIILKSAVSLGKFWVILVLILPIIFFLVLLYKFFPILGFPYRPIKEGYEKAMQRRIIFCILLLLLLVSYGFYGLFNFL
ncbi:MAG: proton-conducting transporter membrane subunit [Leptospiraceae bacterium]|nr:proton-conducting transporter membrane subunit [Leptospiraceae bacterium]